MNLSYNYHDVCRIPTFFIYLLFQGLIIFLNQNQFVLPENHIFIVKRVWNVRLNSKLNHDLFNLVT
jgi:hypothetical protein